ncbi:MAG: DUF2252 family protein, partial [Verrucomicrobiales bacterium]
MSFGSEALDLAAQRLGQPPQARFDAGRSQRDSVPLESHAELSRDPGRADPLAILSGQDASRVPELIPLRYGRMSRSPFTFLRGAAEVMASDLAAGPATGLGVELCGDAHLGNFRWFRAPDRQLVFDLNDFDETLPGPFEWDLKRLAASITVAGRHNGLSKSKCRTATRTAAQQYRQFIAEASELNPLDLHYYRIEPKQVFESVQQHGTKQRKWKEEILAKARRKDSMRALKKLTEVVDGRRVIVPDPPRIVRIDEKLAEGDEGTLEALFER